MLSLCGSAPWTCYTITLLVIQICYCSICFAELCAVSAVLQRKHAMTRTAGTPSTGSLHATGPRHRQTKPVPHARHIMHAHCILTCWHNAHGIMAGHATVMQHAWRTLQPPLYHQLPSARGKAKPQHIMHNCDSSPVVASEAKLMRISSCQWAYLP